MATLIIIENQPSKSPSLSREYFLSEREAFDRALDLIREEAGRSPYEPQTIIALRIESDDDDRTALDDATVRRLASLTRH